MEREGLERDDSAFEGGESAGDELLRAVPGLARIYATAWWHLAEWTLETSVRTSARLARAAFTGERPADLFEEAGADLRGYARRLLDAVDPEGRGVPSAVSDLVGERHHSSTAALRAQGEELLRRSADVRYTEDTHPAYARILGDLTPDEARILRLLATRGPQPSVDVRTGLPLLSALVAPGRTMTGAEAGCRHTERVPAYFNNLYRLGLIWFSREPVKDQLRYQVLEAQPDVLAAMRKGGRTARTVRRSILLTPFGRDFCELCLAVETTALDALPERDAAPRVTPR